MDDEVDFEVDLEVDLVSRLPSRILHFEDVALKFDLIEFSCIFHIESFSVLGR